MARSSLWLGIAVLRGLEARRSEAERLVDDPVSLRLLPGHWRLLLKLLGATGLADAIMARRERELPGVIGSLLCRTRYIDDALREALEAGARQVVVLGAGFDTRAYRLDGMDAAAVFEVDQPDAQRAKRKALERALGALPRHVVLVPVDFEHDDLRMALVADGFQRGARTFFAWEGVTQYISRQAIDATLAFIGSAGAAGSRVAFSYVRAGVVDGSDATDVDRRVMARAERGGAPWRTGLDPAEVSGLLQQKGLRMVEEVGGQQYRTRYLEPAGRKLATLPAERVVLAEVV